MNYVVPSEVWAAVDMMSDIDSETSLFVIVDVEGVGLMAFEKAFWEEEERHDAEAVDRLVAVVERLLTKATCH
jgi:hypothetical protein